MKSPEEVRGAVEKRYAEIARSGASCCGDQNLVQIGYGKEELEGLPQPALMGLGCGNPVKLAALQPGEVVVDLGCGGGIDVGGQPNQLEDGPVLGFGDRHNGPGIAWPTDTTLRRLDVNAYAASVQVDAVKE